MGEKFPGAPVDDAGAYLSLYIANLAEAAGKIDPDAIRKAAEVLLSVIDCGGKILSCGNGGSAAIADHLACDYLKGIRTDTHVHPVVISLVSTVSLVTAIANDIGYEDVFRYQLESLAAPGDVVIAISSSGQSPNIVNALIWAKEHGVHTIALTGFEGGGAAKVADISIHVPATNYGIVEDLHQSVMHMLAQYMRQARMDPALVAKVKF